MGIGLSSRAIIGEFYQQLEGEFDKSWVSRVVMLNTDTDQASEHYRFLGNVPAMRKWTGQRRPVRLTSKGLTIINEPWETSLDFPVDDIRRDKTGQINVRIADLVQRATDHFAKQVSRLITDADGATSGLAYDGQYFLDTDHSEGDSGSQKNLLVAADVPQLAVTDPDEVQPADFSRALLAIIGKMFGFNDDQGEPMNGSARQFMVMTGTQMSGAAADACKGGILIQTSGSSVSNPLKNTDFQVTPVCNPRITNQRHILVFRTDGSTKPFIVQEEVGVSVAALAEGSDYEIQNRAHLFTCEWIGGFGYGQWQHAARGLFSAA